MADDSVQVKIGADVSAAKSGMEDGAASIKASLDGIKSALENFGNSNSKVTSDAIKNNASLSRSFLELKASTTSGFNAITGVIERFRGVLGTLTAALAGGLIGKEAIEALTGMATTVRGLQITFGLGADAATKLAVNLRLAGIEAGTFEQMAFRVGMRIKSAPADFEKLGIAIRNTSTGELLPMEDILQNTYKRMLDFKPGADQMQVALATVGRNAKEFAIDMEMLNATNQRAGQLMEELGIEMGGARQGAVRAYQIEFRAFKVVLDEVGVALGTAMLPKLEQLAKWLVAVGPSVINNIGIAFGILTDAISIVVTAIKTLWSNFVALGETIAFAYTKLVQFLSAIPGFALLSEAAAKMREFGGETNKVTQAILKLSALSTPTGWLSMLLGMKKSNAEAADKIVSDTKDMFRRLELLTADYSAYENDAWSKIEKARAGASMGIPSSGKNENAPDLGKGGGGKDMMAQFKAELDDLNLAQGAFNQLSKLQEMEFWETKLALVKGNGDKEKALRADINREILRDRNEYQREGLAIEIAALHEEEVANRDNKDKQIAAANSVLGVLEAFNLQGTAAYQKALAERAALLEEWAKKEAATAKEIANIDQKMADETVKYSIAMNKQAEDQKVALGLESNAQRLANERAFVDQQYQVDLDGINKRLAAETQGTVAYEKLLAEKLKMEQEHQKQVTQIANQAELDREKYAIEAEKAIVSSITDIFANLITNAKNWKQTLLDGFKALDDQLVKIAANQLVQQYLGASTAGGSFLSGLTSKIFGGGTGGAGAASGAAATTANTDAVVLNTTAQTTATATATLLDTTQTLLITALTSLTAAVAANTAALAGSASGGLGSAFSSASGGGGFDIPAFDVGTPYVPQDTLAFVHKGEAIIPAAYNGVNAGGMTVHNHFAITGPVDTRTMTQIAAQASIGVRRGAARNL